MHARVLALALLLLPLHAAAINGMYLTGYGFESTMLGSADVAVARDPFAANNNPAGLPQVVHKAFEFHIAVNDALNITHDDAYNNREKSDDAANVYFESAYAHHDPDSRFAYGAALVVQGGIGWTFRELNTRFGNKDDIESLFAVVKFAPGVGWQVNDNLRLGIALGVNYFAGGQEVFQHTACSTCFDGGPFNGFRFRGASGIAPTAKLGLQYLFDNGVTLGFTYGTPTHIPVKGGNLRLNLSNAGLGYVKYDKAELQGFHLPEEASLGVSFRPVPPLLVALEYTHYRWAAALQTLTIVATDPRSALAPARIAIPGTAGFRNQDVFALGMEYQWRPETQLYLGLNYGRTPIPERNVTPIFAPIADGHVMVALKQRITRNWKLAAGFEWYTPTRARRSNPLFGGRTQFNSNNVVTQVTLEREW